MKYSVCILFLLVVFHTSAASASRTRLSGSGIPVLLAVDPSNIRLLPGSAGKLDPLGLVDTGTTSSFSSTSNSQVLAIAGTNLRYGYLLDGKTHNLVLAHPSGWGATLGFADDYSIRETHEINESVAGIREVQVKEESVKRELRVGFGWQNIDDSGRVLEVGLAGYYLDWDMENRTTDVFNTQTTEIESGWRSDPGLGFDVTVRSLSQGGGIQLAAHFSYFDLNPESEILLSPLKMDQGSASLDVGWRLQTAATDDLVMGLTSSWVKQSNLQVNRFSSNTTTIQRGNNKTTVFGLFISGEREIVDRLLVRGGVRGLASISDVESFETRNDPNFKQDRETSRVTGQILSPQIFLGAGYRWKTLRADVRLRESISLTNPFLSWSVSMKF